MKDGYGPNSKTMVKHNPPLLYNLEHDPSEKYDVSKKLPDLIAVLLAEVKDHIDKMVPGECQFIAPTKHKKPKK